MKLGQKIAIGYIRARLNILALVSTKKAGAKAFDLFCTPFSRARKKKPPVFEKGEHLHFKIHGIEVRGHRWNAPQPHKALIVHGFESTSYNFDRYIVPLIRKGYEVMAFDAPAHGISEGKRITLPLYVETLREIINRYGPVQSFMAHSFGGLVVAHLLESIEHDENTRVVFLAPATETVTAINSFFEFLQLNGAIREEFDKKLVELSSVSADHFSIRRAARQIKASILWFHDEDDNMTPLSDALKVKEDAHPNIEFVISKGLGHRHLYKDNKVVKRVVEFL